MPPLPEPAMRLTNFDGEKVIERQELWNEEQVRAYAATLIARVAELQRQNEAQKDEMELFAARWQQLEHMYSKGATANTLGHYIGRPERLDYAAKLRAEHDAAIAAKD